MTRMSEEYDVVVVGGGAAGIVAAGRAAELGKKVLLLEKNDRLGMKILISGGGKCNLTHDGPMEELRAQFRKNEARFLKPSFYKFTNRDFLSILHRSSLRTYVRPDGRIFPEEPADAKTVVRLLTDYLNDLHVHIRYNTTATDLITTAGAIIGVGHGINKTDARAVILCVGGSSYPATGTTGDGWRMARQVGHSIVPLRAALAPISLAAPWPEWAGIALRNIVLKARKGSLGTQGKEFARFTGDMLYTHKGISGPAALAISREVAETMTNKAVVLIQIEADTIPDRTFDDIRDDYRAQATANPKATVGTLLAGTLPSRIMPDMFELVKVSPDQRLGQLTARQLTKIVLALKEWPLGQPWNVPLERGEVVAGGIALDEVDPQTMQSKLVPGLYLCGEILDIAGPVGGYNLQAAWSTGYSAGTASARDERALDARLGTFGADETLRLNG
jgi:predicted Rossmann fold flavoprotein